MADYKLSSELNSTKKKTKIVHLPVHMFGLQEKKKKRTYRENNLFSFTHSYLTNYEIDIEKSEFFFFFIVKKKKKFGV